LSYNLVNKKKKINHQSKHNLYSFIGSATHFRLNHFNIKLLYKANSKYTVMIYQHTVLISCSFVGSHVTIIIAIKL